MSKEIANKFRSMASIETSALFSQRKTLNEAADLLEKAESQLSQLYEGSIPIPMSDKIEQVATHKYEWGETPVYKEKDIGTMGNTDTMALLTRMVNELKAENEMLKQEIFKKQFESSTSSLGKQMADVEAGKVVPR